MDSSKVVEGLELALNTAKVVLHASGRRQIVEVTLELRDFDLPSSRKKSLTKQTIYQIMCTSFRFPLGGSSMCYKQSWRRHTLKYEHKGIH